jgi:hypothetical protein
VRYLDIFLHALVSFVYKAVGDFFVSKVAVCELLAIAGQFGLESSYSVEAHGVGFTYFEFKLGIEVQIFAEAGFREVGVIAVVFGIYVGEL